MTKSEKKANNAIPRQTLKICRGYLFVYSGAIINQLPIYFPLIVHALGGSPFLAHHGGDSEPDFATGGISSLVLSVSLPWLVRDFLHCKKCRRFSCAIERKIPPHRGVWWYFGAPWRTRTVDTKRRRLVLYPSGLMVHGLFARGAEPSYYSTLFGGLQVLFRNFFDYGTVFLYCPLTK